MKNLIVKGMDRNEVKLGHDNEKNTVGRSHDETNLYHCTVCDYIQSKGSL